MSFPVRRPAPWVLLLWMGFLFRLVAAQAAGKSDSLTLRVLDRAGIHRFEIASDEAYVRQPSGRDELVTLPTSPAIAPFRQRLARQSIPGRDLRLVAYAAGEPRNRRTARIVTGRILVRLAPGSDSRSLASEAGVQRVREMHYAPGHVLVSADDPLSTLELVARVRRHPVVLSAEVQLGRFCHRDLRPNDPLFDQLWYFEATPGNESTPGADIDILEVWDRFRGAGQLIGVIDDAIQIDHPDLAPNVDPEIRYDFLDDDDDPSPVDPKEDFHGTGVAGLAAARGNNGLGVLGAAFEAGLAPIRLINEGALDDSQIAGAFGFRNDVIGIKNNSWGSDTFDELEVTGFLAEQALDAATAHGRGGLGTILVFSAGNERDQGDNLNYNGLKLRPDVITVGATGTDGRIASYSTPGAPLVISAPGDVKIIACDLTGPDGLNGSDPLFDLSDQDYTRRFVGTSASAPLVSGVVALMLEANPRLGWRDVQEVLMRSAKVVGATPGEFATNSAGFHFSHRYGAGLLQASEAVALAEKWTNLAPARSVVLRDRDLALAIPESDRQGVIHSMVVAGDPIRVEHVLVTLDITHPSRGQLFVILTSPNGMQSRLATSHSDTHADYQGWTFQSRRHWGETSTGKWSIEVRDAVTGGPVGTLNSVALELRGVPLGPVEIVDRRLEEPAGAANGDGAVQAGEAVGEWIVLSNVTSEPLAGITAALSSSTPGVTLIRATASYPDLSAGGLGTNSMALLYRLGPEVPCGTELKFVLVAGTDNRKATNSFTRIVGRRILPELSTNRFEASLGLPLTIPDQKTAFATNAITPPAPLVIQDLKVSLRLDHTAVGDVQISLIHPDGTEVLLSGNRGGDNPNFGTGACGAGEERTEFDDSAPQRIGEGQVPFVGSWRPDEPLSAFRDKPLGGLWRLRVTDVFDEDAGTLFCWAVTATVRVAASDCGAFDPELRILDLSRDGDGKWRVRGKGAAQIPATLEASSDFAEWKPVASMIPEATEFEFRIPDNGEAFRFLRLRQ